LIIDYLIDEGAKGPDYEVIEVVSAPRGQNGQLVFKGVENWGTGSSGFFQGYQTPEAAPVTLTERGGGRPPEDVGQTSIYFKAEKPPRRTRWHSLEEGGEEEILEEWNYDLRVWEINPDFKFINNYGWYRKVTSQEGKELWEETELPEEFHERLDVFLVDRIYSAGFTYGYPSAVRTAVIVCEERGLSQTKDRVKKALFGRNWIEGNEGLLIHVDSRWSPHRKSK